MKNSLAILGLVSALALPGIAVAQQGGAAAGAATGAVGGAIVGGPVGAAVGAVGGAIVGGIADADRREFRTYVETQRVRPYRVTGDIVVGTTLPATGVEYYEVPARFKVQNYRYTVVNGKTVLVDPGTRRIVEVID
jgi:hypothetical protein